MNVIEIKGITKSYGNQKGIFDITFSVKQGECLGFLGPNGAGKTTTIRHLMGFIRPDCGSVTIYGKDCFFYADSIQNNLGYLPGEIAFMEDMTGNEFIQFMIKMKKISSKNRAKELIELFELDVKGKIKKMSKGMKQKIGIVCAFMQDTETLLLDEPTSGLDPLMQNRFIDLILSEKKRGKTILMSSHIFEEIERTCDRCAIIKDGKLISVEPMEKFQGKQQKIYQFRFATEKEAQEFSCQIKKAQIQKIDTIDTIQKANNIQQTDSAQQANSTQTDNTQIDSPQQVDSAHKTISKKTDSILETVITKGTMVTLNSISEMISEIDSLKVDSILKIASQFTVEDLTIKSPSLEELFLHFYGRQGGGII